MTSPIYNPSTKLLLDRVADKLPHALLLEGADGVGLATVAKQLAWRELAGIIQPTDTDGTVDVSAKGVIRVPQIRELIQATRGKFTTRQVFIIDDADKLNIQAQNAFLKLLEEPAPNIHFLLTTHTPHTLLPTVLSRVQRLPVKLISTEDSKALITKLGVTDPRKVQQLLFMASGRPAQLSRLVNDEKLFSEQAKLMADARDFIGSKPYQRAIIAAKYYSDRAKTLQLLTLAQSIIGFSLANKPSRDLIDMADRLADTYDRILANGNTRLQLMNFVIH
jgi:hypothetical protein